MNGLCTDGAANMTVCHSGAIAEMQVFAHQEILATHCIIHWEQLSAKNVAWIKHSIEWRCKDSKWDS